MKPVEPIETVELFPELSAELLTLLRSLSPSAWENPTACADWTVKDVVAHLLGGTLGRLAFGRDKLKLRQTSPFPSEWAAQVAWINQHNAEWIHSAQVFSPPLLIDFLALTDPQLYDYFKTLPPLGSSGPAVSWAGESSSPNWFDIAREYTEKWLHQQHIREAIGVPLLAQRKWLHPVLDTFLRALPHSYRTATADEGAAILVKISGEAGGDWSLLRQGDKWQLFTGAAPNPVTTITLDQNVAWRLFTKGINPSTVTLQVEGDQDLGSMILQMVSIMA